MKKYQVDYSYEAPNVCNNNKWFEVEAENKTQARRKAWIELAESHPTATTITINYIDLV